MANSQEILLRHQENRTSGEYSSMQWTKMCDNICKLKIIKRICKIAWASSLSNKKCLGVDDSWWQAVTSLSNTLLNGEEQIIEHLEDGKLLEMSWNEC